MNHKGYVNAVFDLSVLPSKFDEMRPCNFQIILQTSVAQTSSILFILSTKYLKEGKSEKKYPKFGSQNVSSFVTKKS